MTWNRANTVLFVCVSVTRNNLNCLVWSTPKVHNQEKRLDIYIMVTTSFRDFVRESIQSAELKFLFPSFNLTRKSWEKKKMNPFMLKRNWSTESWTGETRKCPVFALSRGCQINREKVTARIFWLLCLFLGASSTWTWVDSDLLLAYWIRKL